MITVKNHGDFKKTFNFFEKKRKVISMRALEEIGEAGVAALVKATPKDSGETASAWSYEIQLNGKYDGRVIFTNNEYDEGLKCPVVVILQYGHGCSNGSYVQGIDFINPALAPIFNDMIDKTWEEIIK